MSGRDLTITKTVDNGVVSYTTHYDSQTDSETFPSLRQAVKNIYDWLEYDCITTPSIPPSTVSQQELIHYVVMGLGIDYIIKQKILPNKEEQENKYAPRQQPIYYSEMGLSTPYISQPAA